MFELEDFAPIYCVNPNRIGHQMYECPYFDNDGEDYFPSALDDTYNYYAIFAYEWNKL
jgi:hypothetical protein